MLNKCFFTGRVGTEIEIIYAYKSDKTRKQVSFNKKQKHLMYVKVC